MRFGKVGPGLGLIALAAALVAPAAQAEVNRGAVLGYEVFVGGIKAGSFETGLGIGEATYSMELIGRTLGMVDYMVGWRVSVESAGTNNALRPREHRALSTFRGTKRTVIVDYKPDGSVDALIEPPPEQDDRDPVTAAHRHGTIDPLSGVLALSRRLAEGRDCTLTLPMFDGRRRFDAVMTDGGRAELKPSRYNMFSGTAHVCDLVIKRVAGYSKRPSDWNRREDAASLIRTWWASVVPGTPPVPVRIESEGTFGAVVVHLVRGSTTPGRPVMAATP